MALSERESPLRCSLALLWNIHLLLLLGCQGEFLEQENLTWTHKASVTELEAWEIFSIIPLTLQ
jgi:hypothetical protein